MKIIGYSKCDCGAITICCDNGDYSCKAKNLKKYFPDIDLRKIKRYKTTFTCNHCVNRYGLDLCGCGSGEDFGKCDNDFPECKTPMQKIDEYTRIKGCDSFI